jgi:hypothetical protein
MDFGILPQGGGDEGEEGKGREEGVYIPNLVV